MKSEKKITYESFTERVANRAKVSNAEANTYIHQFSETAGKALEDGDEVQLYRFGRFVTSHVDAHPGHNPVTGEAITIPDHTRVDFHPYKALLDAVNRPFRHLRTRMLSEDKTTTRSNALFWLLLLLALLALMLGGFAINSWMSNKNSTLAGLEMQTIGMEPTTIQVDTVVNKEAPVIMNNTVSSPEESITATTSTTSIIVTSGDTLWGIAAAQWGDSSWWPLIYAENRADVMQRNPDLIETGSLLRLPVLEASIAQATDENLRQKTDAYRIVADDYTRLSHHRAAEYRLVAKRGFTE